MAFLQMVRKNHSAKAVPEKAVCPVIDARVAIALRGVYRVPCNVPVMEAAAVRASRWA